MLSYRWRRRILGLFRWPKRKEGGISIAFALKGFFIVVAIWLVVTLLAMWLAGYDSGKASQWGDAFGIVNSLFAALAFLGIIATILLQSRELELQREELRLTREEITKTVEAQQSTAEAQERSAEALKQQAEALFSSAYLNALASLQKTQKAPRTLAIEFTITSKAVATSRLESIVEMLTPKVGGKQEVLTFRQQQLSAIEELEGFRKAFIKLEDNFQGTTLYVSHSLTCIQAFREYLNSLFETIKEPEQWSALDLWQLKKLLDDTVEAATTEVEGINVPQLRGLLHEIRLSLFHWLEEREGPGRVRP